MHPKSPGQVYLLTHPDTLRVDSTTSYRYAQSLVSEGWRLLPPCAPPYADGYTVGYLDALCAVSHLWRHGGELALRRALDAPMLSAWAQRRPPTPPRHSK